MRSSAVLISALVATVAAAAGSDYTLPAGFNINQVDPKTRESWCTAERNSCPKICDGTASSNSCDPDTLDFSCVCSNGTTADVSPYMQTVPYFVCQANFGQCISNHPNDLDGQEKCKASADCGTLNATEASSSSSSSASPSASGSASSTPSATMATTTQAGGSSSTGSSTGSSSTTTGNAAALVVQEYSTSLFAAGLFIALGIAL